MLLNNRKPEVGKWTRLLRLQSAWTARSWHGAGWYVLEIGCFKTIAIPEVGGCFVRNKHYRGVWLRVFFWLPVEVEQCS